MVIVLLENVFVTKDIVVKIAVQLIVILHAKHLEVVVSMENVFVIKDIVERTVVH